MLTFPRKLLFLVCASAVLTGAPVALVLVPQPVRLPSDPRAFLAETVSLSTFGPFTSAVRSS